MTAQLQMPIFALLNLTVNYRWQDRMGSYTDTNGQIQSYHPYSIVDCRLAWNADTYSLYMEANNLFSKKYVDYGNVPQPGTWLMAGFKYNLNI